jgi:hypothetical protein
MPNEAMSKLFECHGTGLCVPAETPMVLGAEVEAPKVVTTEEEQLPPSPKPEFDPNIVTNGLVDGKNEGGTSIARSTGMTGMSDKAAPGDQLGFIGGGSGPYELSGFTARYDVPGSTDIGSVEVVFNFPTITAAQSVISGANNYRHTTPKGIVMDCVITKGAPVICTNESEKLKYVDGAWIRP